MQSILQPGAIIADGKLSYKTWNATTHVRNEPLMSWFDQLSPSISIFMIRAVLRLL